LSVIQIPPSAQRLVELDDAIDHFQQALRINPKFAGAYNNLGIALREKGRPVEAIEHFVQVDCDSTRVKRMPDAATAGQSSAPSSSFPSSSPTRSPPPLRPARRYR
jgi:hypothetical protein